MTEIVGWVGIKNDRLISGWIADKGNLEEPLAVTVSAGTWTSARIIAHQYRDHLRKRGFGTARYGFEVRVPVTIGLEAGQKVSVIAEGHHGVEFTARVPKSMPQQAVIDGHQALKIIADGGLPAREGVNSIDELAPFAKRLLKQNRLSGLLRDAGRALTRQGDADGALRLFGAALQLAPNSRDTMFHNAVAASRAKRHDEALGHFRKLYADGWRRAKVASEFAQALRRAIEQGGHDPDRGLLDELVTVVRARLDLGDVDEGILPSAVAGTLGRLGAIDLALDAIDHTLALRPDRSDAHVAKARLLLENKRVSEGLEIAGSVLARWPENESAAHMVRAYRHLADVKPDRNALVFLDVEEDGSIRLSYEDGRRTEPIRTAGELQSLARKGSFDWVSVGAPPLPAEREVSDRRRAILSRGAAGCIPFSGAERLWKATAMGDALEADLVAPRTLVRDLAAVERFYIRPAQNRAPGRAMLVSRYGALKFGGAEHFLHTAALHYARAGYRPVLLGDIEKTHVGTVSDLEPQLDHDFVRMEAADLRRLIVEQDVTLVHALSGLGFLMASALGDMNVPFIYGVHYFREILGGDGGEVYFDPDGDPIPRPDFAYLLARASTVYANSTFTRDLIEKAHGVRCPVIFSVPDERPA